MAQHRPHEYLPYLTWIGWWKVAATVAKLGVISNLGTLRVRFSNLELAESLALSAETTNRYNCRSHCSAIAGSPLTQYEYCQNSCLLAAIMMSCQYRQLTRSKMMAQLDLDEHIVLTTFGVMFTISLLVHFLSFQLSVFGVGLF